MSIFGRSYGRQISGDVRLKGELVDVSNVDAAIRAGLAYVTEDRKALGLILDETIERNITLANLGAVSNAGVLNEAAEQQTAERYRKAMNIRTPSVFQRVINLSGGNQQKVVLSKWLFADPEVLILDEPTRGIDVGAKYEIYKLVGDLATGGAAVLIISSEIEELLGICDRILVISRGDITDEVSRESFDRNRIMRAALQTHLQTGGLA
jgi:putative multiple sugar transport system ATP-binding protein